MSGSFPDALLADLQSTTSHIATYQQQQSQQEPSPTQQHHTVTKTTIVNDHRDWRDRDGFPDTAVNGNEEQPIYEPQVVRSTKSHKVEETTTSVSRTQYEVKPLPLASQQALPAAQGNKAMTPLSNNLSELDSLLQDLSSAQFMAEVDRRNAGRVVPI